MSPLTIVIVLNLVLTISIATLSSNHKVLTQTKHKISNVLGIQKIAQIVDTPPLPDSPTPTDSTPNTEPPTDLTNPPDNPTTPEPITAPTLNSSPIDQNPTLSPTGESPTPDILNSPSDMLNPNPTPQNPEAPVSSQEPTPSPNIVNTNIVQTEAVLNPADLINSPENINSQSIDEAKKEEAQIANTQNPTDQTKLLINFATDKVKDMDNFIKTDDFSSSNFAALRFNEEINQAIGNLDKLSPQANSQLKKQLVNFCNQADRVLRTVSLSMPEESEQDFEMARGQCQEIQP